MTDPAAITPGSQLQFLHQVNTEPTFDGGVLEYSTDNGTSWFDILAGNGGTVPANANRFVQNGYNSPISTAFGSPIGGRPAWHGNSQGFITTIVDLSDFAGESVRFRWRMACDTSVSATGWWVDNVFIFSPSNHCL